jgi:hypothetical protein
MFLKKMKNSLTFENFTNYLHSLRFWLFESNLNQVNGEYTKKKYFKNLISKTDIDGVQHF